MSEYKSIVFSGLPLSGKSTLIEALSKDYDMRTFSVGGMLRGEHQNKYPNNDLSFDQYYRRMTPEASKKLNADLKLLFENVEIIGDSRYVSYLNKEKCLLVFMTADIETRVKRSMERGDYPGKSATQTRFLLELREADEIKNGMHLSGVDYRNRDLYHLTINSASLSIEEELLLVKSLFRPSQKDAKELLLPQIL
jgi:cytidylate kinase